MMVASATGQVGGYVNVPWRVRLMWLRNCPCFTQIKCHQNYVQKNLEVARNDLSCDIYILHVLYMFKAYQLRLSDFLYQQLFSRVLAKSTYVEWAMEGELFQDPKNRARLDLSYVHTESWSRILGVPELPSRNWHAKINSSSCYYSRLKITASLFHINVDRMCQTSQDWKPHQITEKLEMLL